MWISRSVWDELVTDRQWLRAQIQRLTGGGVEVQRDRTPVPAWEALPHGDPTTMDRSLRDELDVVLVDAIDARAARGTDEWFRLAAEAKDRLTHADPRAVAQMVLDGEPVVV